MCMFDELASSVLRIAEIPVPSTQYWVLLRLQREYERISCFKVSQTTAHSSVTDPIRMSKLNELRSMKMISLQALETALSCSASDCERVRQTVFLLLDIRKERLYKHRKQHLEGIECIEAFGEECFEQSSSYAALSTLSPQLTEHILPPRTRLYNATLVRQATEHILCLELDEASELLLDAVQPLWRALKRVWNMKENLSTAAQALSSAETCVVLASSRADILQDGERALHELLQSPHFKRLLGPDRTRSSSRQMLIAVWSLVQKTLLQSVPTLLKMMYTELSAYEFLPDRIQLASLQRTRLQSLTELQRLATNLHLCIMTLSNEAHSPQPATIRNAVVDLVTMCCAQAQHRILPSTSV